MIIWLAIFIPVLTAIVLYVFFRHKTVWWEFALPFVVSVIVIGFCYMVAIRSATYDIEYWGNYFTGGEYYEPWNELVVYTDTHTDSEGNSYTETHTRVDYHSAEWHGLLNSGQSVWIDEGLYQQMKSVWGVEEFEDMKRDFHSKDGDKYATFIRGDDSKLFTYFSTHSYINKIQASKSIFKFKEVNPKDYGLYDYPVVKDCYVPSILGDVGFKVDANRLLDILNAKYGMDKKMRVWLLLFKDKPLQAGLDQENYWMGGNKNEFVVCVGLKGNDEVDWCYVFSWSEKELVKIKVREQVMDMKTFNSVAFVVWLKDMLVKNYEKKSFKDFDYLTVEPGMIAICVAFIVTLMVNIGISFFIVLNEFQEGVTLRNTWMLERFTQRRVRW